MGRLKGRSLTLVAMPVERGGRGERCHISAEDSPMGNPNPTALQSAP